MRILDWRSRGERWLVGRRRADGAAGPRPAGVVAGWWGRLHGSLLARRIAGRDRPAVGALVVSVGNLALGGTGKTPVVADTAARLAAAGVAGAIVTRGYGSRLAGPVDVTPGLAGAGDEARLLAGRLDGSGWRVVQARSRERGVAHALAGGTALRVVLLEDGHQSAGAGRHLDVVILDSWRVDGRGEQASVVPETGAVFPFGPWREAAGGAARAGLWLLETEADVPGRGTGGARVLTFTRRGRLRRVAGTETPPERPALVSGIARPERFEREAAGLLPAAAVLAVRLGDHAAYDAAVRDRLLREMRAAGADGLVTTAKDWVKLAEVWPADVPAHVVDLDLVWGQDETPADIIGGRLAEASGTL